jgi:hypothetical protein
MSVARARANLVSRSLAQTFSKLKLPHCGDIILTYSRHNQQKVSRSQERMTELWNRLTFLLILWLLFPQLMRWTSFLLNLASERVYLCIYAPPARSSSSAPST